MSSNYAPRTRTSTGRSDPNSPVLLRVYFIALMLHDVCEFSEKKNFSVYEQVFYE